MKTPVAIESAITLARCLRDCTNPTDAFSSYERLRRDRVERIIAYGAKAAASKAAGPLAALLRDTFMTIGLNLFYKQNSDAWLLGHHTDWDTPVTRNPTPTH